MRLSSREASVLAGSTSSVCVGRAKEGNTVTTTLSHALTARLHSWSSGRDKALSGPLLPSLVPLLAGCFEVHKAACLKGHEGLLLQALHSIFNLPLSCKNTTNRTGNESSFFFFVHGVISNITITISSSWSSRQSSIPHRVAALLKID